MKKTARLSLGVLGGVAIVGAVGCGTTVTPVSSPSSAAPAAQAASSAPSQSPSPTGAPSGGIGSSFQVTDSKNNQYDVTLVKVIDPAQGANEFSTPDNGKRFVGIVLTIKGVTGNASDDANSDALITGSNNQQYQSDFNSIAGYTDFNSGEFDVSPGQTVTGAITFQIPNGVKVANVQWAADPFSGATGTWNL